MPTATLSGASRVRAYPAVCPFPRAWVAERRAVTHDLMVLKLEPEVPFPFKPGQYCTIGVDGVERAYSIVSAPHEDQMELFIELVPNGQLTPSLWRLRPGETVSLRPRARGLFTLSPDARHHLMVATVTGVVPYVSILRDYFHEGGQGHWFYLLSGASYQDELAYHHELQRMAKAHPGALTYVPTVSRPQDSKNSGWDGEHGRVHALVPRCISMLGLDPASTQVYACGHPGMIEELKALAAPMALPVKEERFWKE